MLRNEVGWYDKEENSPEVLSIRLGHDAAYVKATFSNRLSVFIQDISAVCVAIALALVLEWRFGLVALATIPLLVFASITQVFLFTPSRRQGIEHCESCSRVKEGVYVRCFHGNISQTYKCQCGEAG